MKPIIKLLLITTLLASCGEQSEQHLSKIQGQQININQQLPSDPKITALVAPYQAKLSKKMNVVLSHATRDLKKTDGVLESTMGNFLADLCYQQAQPIFYQKTQKNIDFVLLNHGGMRAEFSKGEITVGDAYKLMPFDNQLVVVELPANKIKAMIQYLIEKQRPHPISKQLRLEINSDGSHRLQINGQQLSDERTYYVLTSDYLQSGGDNMLFFKNPLQRYPLNYQIRDAIIDYLRENDTVDAKLDHRFSIQEQPWTAEISYKKPPQQHW